MQRRAFTMLELVFVIIILGILASLTLSNVKRDRKQEAADTILSLIRYTQHLALTDFEHNRSDTQWHRKFWQISVKNCSASGIYLEVGSDLDKSGSLSVVEAAIDPSNGKYLSLGGNNCSSIGSNVSKKVLLTDSFSVSSVSNTGGCNGVRHIGFDHLGRAHTSFTASTSPDYSTVVKTTCHWDFNMSNGETFKIDIEPETGYAHIVDQNHS